MPSYTESRAWCGYCGKQRLARRPNAQTFLWAFMTVLSCFLLSPLWLLHELGAGRPRRCSVCGSKV